MESTCSHCTSIAVVKCQCSPAFMCEVHVMAHMMLKGKHALSLISSKPSPVKIQKTKKNLFIKLQEIHELQSFIKSETVQIIREVHILSSEALRKLEKIERIICSYISKSELNINDFKHIDKIAEPAFFISPNVKSIDKLSITQFYLQDFIKHPAEENGEMEFCRAMCYPDPSTNQIICVNPLKNYDSKIILETPDNFSEESGICVLPNNKSLVFSPDPINSTLSVYLIDLEANTAQKKPSLKHYPQSGICVYFNDYVYLFGGQLNCLKYNLASGESFRLSALPKPISHSTTVLLKEKVLIAGSGSDCIYQYDINKDSFISVFKLGCSYKILCKADGKVFLFDRNKLFQNLDEECKEFKAIKEDTGIYENPLKTYPIRSGQFLFFIINDSIYRFDFAVKDLKIIRKVKLA